MENNMEKLIKQIIACGSENIKDNVIRIMAECCELGLDGATYLELKRRLKTEFNDCHYDEDMAELYLSLNKLDSCKDFALDNYHNVVGYDINRWDFVVLWATMIKLHEEKIRQWYPHIQDIDFERKILDECINFLRLGLKPFFDI